MRLALLVLLAACGSVNNTKTPDARPIPDSPPPAPQITSLTPASGKVTTSVTVAGANFGGVQGSGGVTVDGKAATITAWGDTAITMTIPDVLPASVDVIVTAGAGVSAPQKFRVTLPPAIYVENNAVDPVLAFDTVSALAFDPATGATTQIGTPISKGLAPSSYGGCSSSVWLHEHTRHLFASGSTGVAVYNIDPVTGALTPAAGSPFASGGTTSYAVVTNATGTRAFLANYGSSNVSVYNVAADGVLTAVPGSPFAAGLATDTIALSKDEATLFVNSYGGMFGALSVDPTTGALAVIAGTHPGGTAIQRRPAADVLYIPASSGSLGVWSAATSAVTAVVGSPFALAPPAGIIDTPTFTSDGGRMYIGPDNSGFILGYSLAADGTPTALAGSPWNFTTSLTDISCVQVSRDNAYFIAVGEAQQKVGVFALDASGVPTQVTNSPFTYLPTNASSGGLAITF